MREIKFRAWDKGEKWMGEVTHFEFDEQTVFINTRHSDDENYFKIGEIPLMQYTGLKDKNGHDIYEGDIVRRVSEEWEIDAIYKVVWGGNDYPAFDVRPHHDSECNFFTDYVLGDEFGTLEIIGNIYENPELLEAE